MKNANPSIIGLWIGDFYGVYNGRGRILPKWQVSGDKWMDSRQRRTDFTLNLKSHFNIRRDTGPPTLLHRSLSLLSIITFRAEFFWKIEYSHPGTVGVVRSMDNRIQNSSQKNHELLIVCALNLLGPRAVLGARGATRYPTQHPDWFPWKRAGPAVVEWGGSSLVTSEARGMHASRAALSALQRNRRRHLHRHSCHQFLRGGQPAIFIDLFKSPSVASRSPN
ncbi:hypothetical protein CDAR_11641 [Caerostris darwini]|uniref:Uncharacterized protein n=1 Tax=Caerostris darwini TaxID=1538125 RepID=A0AAV4REV5_9ARAC|nr:hypothetical protein CDAR_11641 [Caerostris darwini]